jgi:hypothetical protein
LASRGNSAGLFISRKKKEPHNRRQWQGASEPRLSGEATRRQEAWRGRRIDKATQRGTQRRTSVPAASKNGSILVIRRTLPFVWAQPCRYDRTIVGVAKSARYKTGRRIIRRPFVSRGAHAGYMSLLEIAARVLYGRQAESAQCPAYSLGAPERVQHARHVVPFPDTVLFCRVSIVPPLATPTPFPVKVEFEMRARLSALTSNPQPTFPCAVDDSSVS